MDMNIMTLISQLRALPQVRVEEGEYSASVGPIGSYGALTVGPTYRSVTVTYSGDIRYVADSDCAAGVRAEPVDRRADDLIDELKTACARSGVSLTWAHDGAGVACWYQRDEGARWARLAEQIRVARIGVLERPGTGHEQLLAGLMEQI